MEYISGWIIEEDSSDGCPAWNNTWTQTTRQHRLPFGCFRKFVNKIFLTNLNQEYCSSEDGEASV